jgi:hypothetical protein
MCSATRECPLWANSGHSRTRSPCLIKNLVQCSDVPREKSLFGWEHRCTAPALCVQARGSATPESGHMQCTSSCLLWAKSGHRTTVNRKTASAAVLAKSDQVYWLVIAVALFRCEANRGSWYSEEPGWRFCSMAKLVFGMNQSLDGYVDHLPRCSIR